MGRIEPDMSVFAELRSQPEFKEELCNTSIAASSDWRIIRGKEALRKNAALFARIENDFGVERGTLLALWGVESAYGDPLVQQKPHAADIPRAHGTGLERTAPPRLLGNRTDQRAADRRPRLEHPGGNAGFLGRRDGPHPVDARGLAQRRHGLRQDGRVSPFGKPDDALGSTAR